MKRITAILCIMIAIISMAGCSQISNEQGESSSNDTMQSATEKKTTGQYTLEECQDTIGFYIMHEDGTFDRYMHGGYCVYDGGLYSTEYGGMYIQSLIAEVLPTVSAETNMVAFWDGDFYITLYKVNMETTAMSVKNEDGATGYMMVRSPQEFRIVYPGGKEQIIQPLYINGIEAREYDGIETVSITVHPSKGAPSREYTYTLHGFPKWEKVTIGTGKGSTLVETVYSVDCMYYDFDDSHNNYDERYAYGVNEMPTPNGYATMDFSEVPDGKYVMILDGDGHYIATLVNVCND